MRDMDIHTYQGKRRIGITDVADFTDFEGIGRDPLYKRYVNVGNLIDKVIDPQYAGFLAIPDYDADNGEIRWYVDNWQETPRRLADLPPEEKARYEAIKEETLAYYKSKMADLSGEDLRIMASALRHINDDFIYCADGKVYAVAWGMVPDNARHMALGELVHGAPEPINVKLTFTSGENGRFANGEEVFTLNLAKGSLIEEDTLPPLTPGEGFEFAGFYPNPVGQKVSTPMEFKATYKEIAPVPAPVDPTPEPPAPPAPPEETELINEVQDNEPPEDTDNKDEKKKRKPWWWWLLTALLIALIVLGILALSGVFRSCGDKTENGVAPLPEYVDEKGDTIQDNGFVKEVPIKDGKLPAQEDVTAPVMEEGGKMPPVIKEPGLPTRFADRLILFIEDESGSVDDLADAFKKNYPGENYSVIGYDRYVKSVNVKVPEVERENIKNELNRKIPNIHFIVFDETVYDIKKANGLNAAAKGWHLNAVQAKEGWQITKGSRQVKVAVVDDGIDRTHTIFKDRIRDPYNVFRQTNQLSKGVGHGTMVAGLAVGSLEYQGQGAAGIAPDCSLMPVQVSDNGEVPLSAMVGGIMYAVHQGADVVNVSIGPQLTGLNLLPVNDQVEISRTQFLKEQKLWQKVCEVAAKKNVILVFAAGNDDIISSIPPENRDKSCVVVGAVDEKLYPADFTNYGYCTDISAPGTNIYSSYPTGSFNSMDGTSFSAPIVTGTIALMRSINKNLTVKQANDVLYHTGADVYGFMPPMVQVAGALKAVKAGDFSRGPDRGYKELPPGAKPTGGDTPFESWTIPPLNGGLPVGVNPGNGAPGVKVPGTGPIEDPITGAIVEPGREPAPSNPVNPGGVPDPTNAKGPGGKNSPVYPEKGSSPATPVPPGGSTPPAEAAPDYDMIREKIRRLKKEISELEKQLPENQAKK